ncbi:hypothetical protein TNCV_841551 [Trichonephila clavipes]|nr:hypothetical protein TNCV_841551 [Trichonephila clavipes]
MNTARYIGILTLSSNAYAVHGPSIYKKIHPHKANIVRQFLTKKGAVQIELPPYSPDLNPPNFFLFFRLKLALKGKIFDDIPDIQRNVARLLNSIPKEDLLQSFQDMYSRS